MLPPMPSLCFIGSLGLGDQRKRTVLLGVVRPSTDTSTATPLGIAVAISGIGRPGLTSRRDGDSAALLKAKREAIADELCVSDQTVKNSCESIYTKLGIHLKGRADRTRSRKGTLLSKSKGPRPGRGRRVGREGERDGPSVSGG